MMDENPAKKPKLMVSAVAGETTFTKPLPPHIKLEPKYLVTIDEEKEAVFITIPPNNPAHKPEMTLLLNIIGELKLCPSEWKKSIIRIVGTGKCTDKVYEGGTEYHWKRSTPSLSTIIVVKKTPKKLAVLLKDVKVETNHRVDQQRQLLQKMKEQRKPNQMIMPPPKPVKPAIRSTALKNIIAKSTATSTAALKIVQKKATLPDASYQASNKSSFIQSSTSQQETRSASFSENHVNVEDVDTDDEQVVDGDSTRDPLCEDPPFRIIDWSRVGLPINKDENGRIYFSQEAKAVKMEFLEECRAFLTQEYTFPHDNWNVRIFQVGNSAIINLGIYELNNSYEPLTVLRSIQMFSDGTIKIGCNGLDFTEVFLKKISIEDKNDLKELIQQLSNAKCCSGSIGFDIVAVCDNANRKGKAWYSDDCSEIIFNNSESTCNPCQLVRNALRIEKTKMYRQVQKMEQTKLQESIISSNVSKPEGSELGRAIYDLIGGFWEELKIEEEAKEKKLTNGNSNSTPKSTPAVISN